MAVPHDSSGPASYRPSPSSQEIPSDQELSGALHEISNVLTVVVGWLERAIDAPPAELEKALRVAHARALDGRDIARRAIGALPESSVQQPLESLLEEAILGVLPEASSTKVSVELIPSEHGAVLLDDARIVLQILTNLLLNAVAFSPVEKAVQLSVEIREDEAILQVTNEGPGIPEERRRRLFQRGSSSRRGGAGIGLAHAYEMALHHGGDLSLADVPGKTSFVLRWPCAAVSSSTTIAPRSSATLLGCKVLLIEDDNSIRDLLEIALSARGAEIVAAEDACCLSSSLEQGPFDIVLFDWSPIASNPMDCLSAVRKACPHAPLIAISGSATLPELEAMEFCSAWVRKPFELSELIDVILSSLKNCLT